MGYATENGAFFDCFYLRDELTTAIPGISVPVTFEGPETLSQILLSSTLPNACLRADDNTISATYESRHARCGS
jgi:hypothetical protein